MRKERYMVWACYPRDEGELAKTGYDTSTELDYDVRGFETFERADAFAKRFSQRKNLGTVIEFQTYEINRSGYALLESDFGPWGCSQPEPTRCQS